MAEEKKDDYKPKYTDMQTKLYRVKDADGNVVDYRQYSGAVDPETGKAHGGSLFENAYNNDQAGVTNKVYASNNENEEKWLPVEEAKASIGTVINQDGTADIAVYGPTWYAKEVQNSDWFKQNFSESSTYRALVEASLNNPNGSFVDPNDDSKTITYSEALQKYSDAFDQYAEAYKQMAHFKDVISGTFKSNLSDGQAMIAGTSYDKSDYDKNGAVYIPKWLQEKHDFTKYESWDAKQQSISAEDFFTKYYSSANFDANGIREAKALSRDRLKGFAAYGVMAAEDEDGKKNLEADDYKEELARTISMANIMSDNKAESDAIMDICIFTSGVFTGVFEGMEKTVSGLGQFITDISRLPTVLAKDFFVGLGMDDDQAQLLSVAVTPATSAIYTASSALGEFFGATWGTETSGDRLKDWADGMSADLAAIADKTGDNAWTKMNKEFNEGMNEFWTGAGDLSDKIHVGRFIGNVIWKIVENITILNKVGGFVGGKIFGGALGASTVAAGEAAANSVQAVGGVASVNGIANLMKIMAQTPKAKMVGDFVKIAQFSTNVVTQGILETILDDDDTVHNLIVSGDPQVIEAIAKNTAFNAVGELSGMGMTKAMEHTKVGQAISIKMTRVTNRLGSWKDTGMHKLMSHIAGDTPKEATANKIKFLKESAALKKKIAQVKAFEDVSSEGLTAITKNYEKQQALILQRVKLENAYDAMNAGMSNAMKGVEAKMDPEVVKDYWDQATAMIKEETELIDAGVLTKSDVAGSMLSKESSNYLSLKAQYENLVTKQSIDGTLSAKDLARFESIGPKLQALSDSFDPVYLSKLNSLYDALGKYQSQLNMYKLANGLYTSEAEMKTAMDLMNKGYWGENGERYVHTQRYYADENYADAFYKKLGHEGQRGTKLANEFGEDVDADFVDPLTLSALDLYRTASIGVQRNWQTALLNATGVSRNVIATEGDVKMAKSYGELKTKLAGSFKAKDGSDIDKVIREAFDKNDFFAKQFNRSRAFKEVRRAAQKESREALGAVKKTLGFGRKSTINLTVGDIDANDIMNINSLLPDGMEIPAYNLSSLRADDFNDWFDALPKNSQAQIDKLLKTAGKNRNVTNVRALFGENPDLRITLQRNYLLANEDLMKQKPVMDTLIARRTAQLDAREATILSENRTKYIEAQAKLSEMGEKVNDAFTGDAGKAFADSIVETSNDIIGSMEEVVAKNAAAMKLIDEFEAAGVDREVAKRYITLKSMSNLSEKDIRKSLSKNRFADKELIDASKAADKGKYKIKAETVDHYLDNAAQAIHKNIESEYNMILSQLKGANGELLEPGEVYERVAKYAKDIAGKANAHDVVSYPNAKTGRVEMVQVDPLTADLYNLRPGAFTTNISDYGSGTQHIIKFFNRTNRLFQWGTTGFSLTSFTNQWFRDSLGAVTAGGARPFIDFGIGVEASSSILGKKFAGQFTTDFIAAHGKQIAEGLQKEMSEEMWESFVKGAEEAGISVEEAAVKYAVADTGYKILPGQEQLTTVGYYSSGHSNYKHLEETNKARAKAYESAQQYNTSLYAKGGVKKARAGIDKALDAVTKHQLGEFREVYYRQAVYTSSLGRALDAGMALTDAKEYATRFALDATIDFARPLMIGDAIAKSVPYFGAAINGFESFWRLLEIDPMGIAGRFMGGIVLPGMSAIAKTLDDENDRKIYANIPEYEKEDNLIFVQNGTVISIPLPQEMSVFFAPFRQAVEKAHDANDHSWLSLISADILQVSPVDLSGFVDLDANTLLGDPSFGDRIARGTEKAISSLMPAAAKATYKAITGRDPYTGQDIDKSRYYYDDEGNKQVMDTNQSAFADWLHDQFGDGLSASSAYSIFKDLIGRTGMGIADTIVATLTNKDGKGFENGLKTATSAVAKGLTNPISPEVYNQGRTDWNQAVRQLEKEKAALLSDKSFQGLLQSIAFEDDADKLKKLRAEKNEYVENYQRKVCTMVNNLKDKYPGMYNKSRQASVLALLNMNLQPYGVDNEISHSMSKEIYFQGKQDAINSMQQMGFTTTEDNSILGYGHYNRDGEYEFKFNQPLVIMNMGNVVFGQGELNTANLQNILDVNDITRKNMYGKEWNSLTSKADKKEYKKKWNKKVVTLLAPYISQHGVGILDSYEVRDLLQDYLFIDNPYKTKDYLYSIFTGGEL